MFLLPRHKPKSQERAQGRFGELGELSFNTDIASYDGATQGVCAATPGDSVRERKSPVDEDEQTAALPLRPL